MTSKVSFVKNFAACGTPAVEKHICLDGCWPIETMFRRATGDSRHLIVVFSGFNASKGYHFSGESLNGVKGNILWIRDHFDEHYSYYLCAGMSFEIEADVIGLIDKKLLELGLAKEQCTFLGVSKGGTAAIYFGLKYGFTNIVSLVPQMLIGSYVRARPVTGRFMMGEDMHDDKVQALDALLPQLLAGDENLQRNIYLFTSPADHQYEGEIRPHLHHFVKYANFNFFFTESRLVSQHGEVSRYNVPMLLAVLYSLCDGTVPRYGMVRNGTGDSADTERQRHLEGQRRQGKAVAALRLCRIAGNHLELAGHALLLGRTADLKGDRKTLLISNARFAKEFPLKPKTELNLNHQYFDTHFCNYSGAGFELRDKTAVELLALPPGRYELAAHLVSVTDGVDLRVPLVARKSIDARKAVGARELVVLGGPGGISVMQRGIVGPRPADAVFDVVEVWQREKLFHIEGVFFIPGMEIAAHGDAVFYLILRGPGGTFSFKLGMSSRPAKIRPLIAADDHCCYDAAYFATSRYEGVDIGHLPAGCYEAIVSLSKGAALFSMKAPDLVLSIA